MKTSKNDKQVVGKLANEKYDEWISEVRGVLQQPDSPLSLKDGAWTVAKRKEMWYALGSRLFDDHLDKFKQITIDVLKELDPKFELPSDKRFAANIHGKVLKHSHALRKGLAESLALLGTQPEALKNCSQGKAETVAVTSIREIFEDSDWILWASLGNLLPTLAEAAPEEFLRAVEVALKREPCPFDEIFSQEDTGLFGNNYMTGLLWALETLAWDEKYLVQVTVILGNLDSHDPGGNWANRPANSLTTIFLPWLPQTIASVGKRKAAIQTLQKEFPAVAWKILLDLLPNQHQSSMGSHKPEWRKIIPDEWEKGVTNKEYWDQISFYADIAVETAKGDFDKLNELISNLDNLPEPSFNKLLEYLKSEGIQDSLEEKRASLWTELVKFASKHRRYSDADWALSSELVEEIEKVAKILTPRDPKNLYKRLFDQDDFELCEDIKDWEEQEQKLEERRQNAIQEILKQGNFKEIIQFAKNVGFPDKVGISLGFVAEDNMDLLILPDLIENENKKLEMFASGFTWGRYRNQGWEWVDHIDTSGWSKVRIGKFLTCLPFTQKTWKYSEQLLGEHEIEYWSKVGVYPYQAKDNLSLAIDKLIQYDRPNASIYCLYRLLREKKPIDKTKTVKALLKGVSSTEPFHQMHIHYVVEIIKTLQNDPDINPDDLFSIEWAYLPLLTGPGKRATPKLLEQRLASNPDFFCEAIRSIYRSKNETESHKDPTEQQRMIAKNFKRLLDDWRTLPGMLPDGSISVDDFNDWLRKAKTQCEQTDHIDVAMLAIGKMFIHYVPDPDGLWINRALAEALNAEDAEKMRHGFSMGLFNSRGAHHIDPTGKPEKELASKYRKQAEDVENAGFYRLAITLRGLATSYEDEAKRIINEHKRYDS